jgi:PAS domain S-box-containing protein
MNPDTTRSPSDERLRYFAGLGEMRGRFRTFDWSASPLGRVESWPLTLRSTVSTILASAFANIVLWGPDLIQLYNDGYREIMGAKHPAGLGMPTRECWPEAWSFNAPIYDRVRRGESAYFEDVLIPIVRYGALEDVWFTISYSPILDDAGAVGGVLVTLLETTGRVVAKRLELERERLLASVQTERNRLGALFQRSPTFLAVLRGREHRFELANDAYLQLVGHRQVVGMRVAEALPEVVEQGFTGLLDQVLETGEPFHGREVRVLLSPTPGAAPEERFVDFVYQPMIEADGTRSGVVAHGADVTAQVLARKQVERLLEESERQRAELDAARRELAVSDARFRDVFDQAPMAIAVLTGPQHVYTVVSPMYARYLGQRPLIGIPFRTAVPEEGGQRVALLMDRVFETGEPVFLREQVVPLDRDGDGVLEEYLFDISYQPLRNRDGDVYAITSLSLDVTDQVRARRLSEEATDAIRRSRAELEQVFSQAPVALAVLEGPEHCFSLANAHYEAIVGRPVSHGACVRDALPELDGQGIFEMLDRVYATGEPFVTNELRVVLRRPGESEPSERWINAAYQPLVARDGSVYAIVALGLDVTDQVHARHEVERLLAESERTREALAVANTQLEEQQMELELTNQQLQDNAAELEAQAEELQMQTEALQVQTEELQSQSQALHEQTRLAEAANRAKGDFLATMSHELRTPLNAISGYSDLLLEGIRGPLSEGQREDIGRVRRSSNHLLRLINDLLNFAKLDAGQIEFRLRRVAIHDLIDGLSDLVGPQIAAKSLRFDVSHCDTRVEVLVDPDKVRQILVNLVSNAVKFTAAGGAVSVNCEVTGSMVAVRVADTGRGIPTDELERVFDPFVQVDRHLTPTSHQGIGLGLAISRDLARGMGGTLVATSVVGTGSTFTLTLPMADTP